MKNMCAEAVLHHFCDPFQLHIKAGGAEQKTLQRSVEMVLLQSVRVIGERWNRTGNRTGIDLLGGK